MATATKSFKWLSPSFGEFCRIAKQGALLAGHYMMQEGNESFHKHAVRNTPVDTSTLRDSITEKPVVRHKWGWEAGIYTEVTYAPHVEWGTGLWGPKKAKYIIKPKQVGGVLAFFARLTGPDGKAVFDSEMNPVEGQLVFARYVMHPGSPGNHMFEIGAAMAEHELPRIGNDGMRVMKRYVEAKVKSVI